jgi:subtilisin family serine protease
MRPQMSTPSAHRLRRVILAGCLVALAAGPLAVPAAATGPIVLPATGAPAVAPSPGATPVEDQILIRWRAGTTDDQKAAVERAYGLQRLDGASATPRRGLAATDIATAPGRSPAAVRRALAADPNVIAVAANFRRELAADITHEPFYGDEWGLNNTGQDVDGTSGTSGVDIDGPQAAGLGIGSPTTVVAVIDTGIDFRNADLAARAWTNPGEAGAKATNGKDDDGNGYVDDVHGWDFCNDDNTPYDTPDSTDEGFGHGTHVAGTIAASLDGQGIVGVAPGVKLMALKTFEGVWCGSDDEIVAAIDYAASFGVHLINASWGGTDQSDYLDQAIADSGALLVAAAGNSNVNMDAPGADRFYPAASTLPNVISVAAVGQTGHRASFSNYGKFSVDLSAPGTNILSTYPLEGPCAGHPTCYAWAAGTSMAAPHVTGIAALVGSAADWLLRDPARMRTRLMTRAKPLAATAGLTVTGGLVNAFRAADILAPTVSAPYAFTVAAGTILGTSSIKTTIGWPTAGDAGTGVASYELRRHASSGWTTVAAATTAKSATSTLTFGTDYTFTLRATDVASNVSPTVTTPIIRPSLYQSGTSLASYGTGWASYKSASASKGYINSAWKGGASMTFTATGRSISIVSPKGPTRGSMKVYLDGAYVSTVSLYRSSFQAQVVVFSKGWATAGSHSVRVVDAGTPGHSRVDIDAFVVVG